MSIRRLALLLLVMFSFTASTLVSSTIAQQGGESGGSALQISPTRNEIIANPGDQKTATITLKNISDNEITARVFLNDFESDNQSGSPKIIVDEKEPTPYSLKKMVADLQDVNLKPGETKEVKVVINVPGNAAAGAYFGAIRYAAIPKGSENTDQARQLSLTASIAHLIFVEVPGDVTEQIQIQKAEAQRDGKGGSFFFNAPDKAAVTVKNLGNGFSRPFGRVVVNNSSGKEVYSYEINNTDPKGIVLPNSSRVFVDDIKNVKTPGKYSIVAAVAYGNGGEVVTYKASFWYLPVWFLALVVLLLATIAVGGYLVYKKKFSREQKPTKRRK